MVQWTRLCAPTVQVVWVQSLVKELRFHMLCSVAKNNEKRGCRGDEIRVMVSLQECPGGL